MTQGKHSGPMRESFIDRKIREAQERGEFDNLSGQGKPLPDLDRPRDDLWWVKKLIRREKLSALPETLVLRREREQARAGALQARSESEARRIVADLNAQIRAFNAKPTAGPPSNLMPLDEDEVAHAWKVRRG